jgi:hypothetical protein
MGTEVLDAGVRVAADTWERCRSLCVDDVSKRPVESTAKGMAKCMEVKRDAAVRAHRGHLMRFEPTGAQYYSSIAEIQL